MWRGSNMKTTTRKVRMSGPIKARRISLSIFLMPRIYAGKAERENQKWSQKVLTPYGFAQGFYEAVPEVVKLFHVIEVGIVDDLQKNGLGKLVEFETKLEV